MAKISSSFKCSICQQPLHFPNDIGIIEFVILMLQFYKTHELCENLSTKSETDKLVALPAIKKTRKPRGK